MAFRWATALVLGLFAIICGAATTTYQYDTLGRLTQVTYPNGSTITYAYDALGNRASLTTNVVLSGNADLGSLTVSSGSLAPPFASATLNYSDAVGNGVSAINFTPVTSDGAATVTVNGSSVPSGSPSSNLNLAVGANQVLIIVTAENGTQKTYTVNVSRAASSIATLSNLALVSGALSPSFSPGTVNYAANVFANGNPTRVVPTTTDPASTVTVNGSAVASGTTSGPIGLNAGNNSISVVVTAQDGVSVNTYTVNANLSNITCTYSVSPPDLSNFAHAGGPATITVTTASGCPVAATSLQPWVVVNNVASGANTTTISLQIGPNSGGVRATALVIADRLFLVTQN